MRIRLLTFATATEAVGHDQLDLELEDGTTVGELKAELERRYPALGSLWHRLAVAIDGEIVPDRETIRDDAEVALLPPVSGGAPVLAEARAALVDEPIDVSRVVAAVEARSRGAVLLFLGTVRDHHAGRSVDGITYHAYRPMALRRLERIVRELEAEGEDLALSIVHRLGRLAPGEPSVAIAVGSPHREASYLANRRALERLKAEVPIWKREHYSDGETRWREEESLVSGGAE